MQLNPKEKAAELLDKYIDAMPTLKHQNGNFIIAHAKQSAIIAVDEIISLRKGYFDCTNKMQDEEYWQQVKNEIKLL